MYAIPLNNNAGHQLLEFGFGIQYKQGHHNQATDTLFRPPPVSLLMAISSLTPQIIQTLQ